MTRTRSILTFAAWCLAVSVSGQETPARPARDSGQRQKSLRQMMAINEDNAGELAAMNGHWATNGYAIDNATTNPSTTQWVYRVIDKVMAIF